jgi:hypothetical protein
MGDFSKTIDKFNKKVAKRVRATGREAVQLTIDDAQEPKGDGGNMPIVTGFLRASIQGQVGEMPRGPSSNASRVDMKNVSQIAGMPIAAALVRWNPYRSQDFNVGWTANYARFMEFRYGFMRLAVMKWDSNIKKAAKKASVLR